MTISLPTKMWQSKRWIIFSVIWSVCWTTCIKWSQGFRNHGIPRGYNDRKPFCSHFRFQSVVEQKISPSAFSVNSRSSLSQALLWSYIFIIWVLLCFWVFKWSERLWSMKFLSYLKIKICLQTSQTFVFLCNMWIPINEWLFNVYTMPWQNLVSYFHNSTVYHKSDEWFEVRSSIPEIQQIPVTLWVLRLLKNKRHCYLLLKKIFHLI